MFRVEWVQRALDELANIWMQADSSLRQAITASANTLDTELQANPFRQSESRDDEERVLFVYPLAVQIEVDLQQRIVWGTPRLAIPTPWRVTEFLHEAAVPLHSSMPT